MSETKPNPLPTTVENGLPEGWAACRLGDGVVTDVQPGFACGANNRAGDGIPHLRPMNVTTEGEISLADTKYIPKSRVDSDRKWLQQDDVLFNNTNSTELVGKTAIYDLPEPRAFSNHMTRIRCHPEGLAPRFCAMVLHHKWSVGYFAATCNQHVSQSSISRTVLLDTPISLPPLAEQKRIVAKVEALLARVNAARTRLANVPAILKRFRQSVLAAACSGQLTADWREEHPGVEPAKVLLARIQSARIETAETPREKRQIEEAFSEAQFNVSEDKIAIGELPESWLPCRVGAIGTVLNGTTPSRKHPEYWDGDIAWVSSGEVRNNIITETRERITSLGYSNTSVRLLPSGTVLLAMIGEGKTRGQSAILRMEATINQNIAAVLLSHGLIVPEFLWRWFQFQYEATRMQGGGSGPQALNCQRVRELPFVLPPLDEQSEIVRRVEALFALADKIEARVQAATARVEKITQAILAKAFRGELVPTEAELAHAENRPYEPATALLARIRADRAANDTATKKTKTRRRSRRSTG